MNEKKFLKIIDDLKSLHDSVIYLNEVVENDREENGYTKVTISFISLNFEVPVRSSYLFRNLFKVALSKCKYRNRKILFSCKKT